MILKIFYIIHFLLVFFIIFFILLQQGKGANTGMLVEERIVTKTSSILNEKDSNNFIFKMIFFLIFTFFLSTLVLNKLIYQKNIIQQIAQKNNISNEKIDTVTNLEKKMHLPNIPK